MSEHQLPPDRSVKVAHLVFGLLFLGLAGLWALVSSEVIDADSLPLIAPGVLVAAGVIGLVASLATSRNRQRRDHGYESAAYEPDAYSQTFQDDQHDPQHAAEASAEDGADQRHQENQS